MSCMKRLSRIGWVIAWAAGVGLAVCTGWAQQTIALSQAIPDQLARIEIVWVTGEPPAVTLDGAEPSPILSTRWTGDQVTVVPIAERLRPFGTCRVAIQTEGGRVQFIVEGEPQPACGLVWWLGHPDEAIDLLSFHWLQIEGTATETVDIGLVDRRWWKKQDAVSLVRSTGSFRSRIPLRPFADRVDLRQIVALTLTVSRAPAVVTIEHVHVDAQWPEPKVPRRGLWVWNLQRALREPDRVLAVCMAIGCRRLSIQMPAANADEEIWRAYLDLVRRWRREGVEVYALDGDPHVVIEPRPLFATLKKLLTLAGEQLPDGVQLDIEPYLLGQGQTDSERYADYLAVLTQIRQILPVRLPVSVVVPFWFTGVMIEGRPLGFRVLELADEAVIMNYRVEFAEARALIDDWVRYGALMGKPVWGAVETRPLPDERHLILRRVDRAEQATAYVDRRDKLLVLSPPAEADPSFLYFSEESQYSVLGSRLSFSGSRRDTLVKAIEQWTQDTRQPRVAGLMIHDWEGYEQLSDGPPH